MDENHLSYPIRKKTAKILKLKEELEAKKKNIIFPGVLTGLCTCYIVFFGQRYSDAAVATIIPWSGVSGKFLIQDKMVLLLLLCSVFFMFSYLNSFNKTKLAFNALRKDLINTIDTEFCKCSKPQQCKDEYIKSVEEQGIS